MEATIRIDRAAVEAVHGDLVDRGPVVVPLINRVRERLGRAFEVEVARVETAGYEGQLEAVFADPDRAINVAGLVRLLEAVDAPDDYPGFVVDEHLGRELAGTIAGEQPWRMLAESTYHFADSIHRGDPSLSAGVDDLEAAVAAGVQTRLPGWDWTDGPGPFGPRDESP
ncbi:MAG: hypothetical protein ACOC0X_06755 [Halobacteriota archaeon]